MINFLSMIYKNIYMMLIILKFGPPYKKDPGGSSGPDPDPVL